MEPKKSKRLVTVILVISAILGLASIGTAYYFYNIRDVTPQDTSAAEGCSCYYVDTASGVESCTDATAKQAFAFKTGTKTGDDCSATCDLRIAPETTGESDILSCSGPQVSSNPGCVDIAVENSEGERITTPVSLSDKVTVTSTFEPNASLQTDTESDFYDSFSFVINGERIEVDSDNVVKEGSGADEVYTASIDFSDYGDAETLSIQAFADSQFATDVSSAACLREVKVAQPTVASCSAIDVDAVLDANNSLQVNEILMTLSGVAEDLAEDGATVTVEFTANDTTTLQSKDFSENYTNGTLILDKDTLYAASNFDSGSFSDISILDNKVQLDALVSVNGTEIDSDACTSTIEFQTTATPTQNDDTDTTNDGDSTDDTNTPTDTDTSQTTETSTFSVEKAGTPACVERVSPNNTASYTITVTNDGDAYDDIDKVVDKLPLGFSYVEGSSEINGTEVADTDYVTVETVGSAEEITWDATDDWSIASDGTLVITFNALITEDALTGNNTNEVVVTPVNTPEDASTLRTEFILEVSQNCSTPETGLFDSMIGRLIASILVMMLGATFYMTGGNLSEKLAGNPAVASVSEAFRMFGLKVTDPRKHFEEKVSKEVDKRD